MGKNKHVKSGWNKGNYCGCHYCTGTTYEDWLELKHNLKPKHKNTL